MTISVELTHWRKERRAELLRLRMAASEQEHQQWSQAVNQFLEAGFPILGKLVIGICWPYKAEFDPRFAAKQFRDQGARIALPAVVKKDFPLEFREWWPGVKMTEGVFDLPVPDDTDVLIPDAMLIPPVGFGEQGDRLGYGGGFFDRTLASISPQPLKIGVAFELSRMPTTYPQEHDILMDFIITELGIHVIEDKKMRVIDAAECKALSEKIVMGRTLPRKQNA